MTEPKPPEPVEPLVEPATNQVTDRIREAYDCAPASMPEKMTYHERGRIRAAITAAHQRYPKSVARVLEEYLRSWEDVGFRWGNSGPVHRLIDELLRPAAPAADAA